MRLENNVPYKIYDKLDITNIQSCLKSIDQTVWTSNNIRQGYNQGPHTKTQNIVLQWCRGEPEIDYDFYDKYPQYKSGKIPVRGMQFVIPNEKDFYYDIQNIKKALVDTDLNYFTNIVVDKLKQQFDGISGSIVFVKLPPGKKIKPHSDPGYYLSVVHRLHIPIFTNDKCLFTLDATTVNMKEGYLYEINNLMKHSVENDGDSDRIHLIVDIIPNSVVNK